MHACRVCSTEINIILIWLTFGKTICFKLQQNISACLYILVYHKIYISKSICNDVWTSYQSDKHSTHFYSIAICATHQIYYNNKKRDRMNKPLAGIISTKKHSYGFKWPSFRSHQDEYALCIVCACVCWLQCSRST